MADVRLAQIGQLSVNQPIIEFRYNNQGYVFATDKNDRIQFKNRGWLQSMGISSIACDQFADTISNEVRAVLKLDDKLTTKRPTYFSAQTYGTGFAFVPDFDPRIGWKNLFPAGNLMYQF